MTASGQPAPAGTANLAGMLVVLAGMAPVAAQPAVQEHPRQRRPAASASRFDEDTSSQGL